MDEPFKPNVSHHLREGPRALTVKCMAWFGLCQVALHRFLSIHMPKADANVRPAHRKNLLSSNPQRHLTNERNHPGYFS
jgi:hypothetical protein